MAASKTTAKKTTARKSSSKPKVTSDPVSLSSIYAKVAARKGIDTTRSAKLVRAKMRANFDEMTKLSPNVGKSKSHANDGNRWPEKVTPEAASFVLGKFGIDA